MNNKLFARIAAAAVGVSMLATVAFAAPADPDIVPDITESGSITFIDAAENNTSKYDDVDQITLMAYIINDGTAVDPEKIPTYDEDTMTIVALDQVAGEDGFSVIPLDATLVGDAKEVIVKVGGTGIDTPFETVIALGEEGGEDPVILLGDMNGNGEIDMDDSDILFLYMADYWDDIINSYGLDPESTTFNVYGDVNGNGEIDMDDSDILFLYMADYWDDVWNTYGVRVGEMSAEDFN